MPPKTHPSKKTAGAKKVPTIKTGIKKATKKTFAQKTLHLNSAGSSKKKSCSVCKEDPCSCKKTSKKVGATKKAVVKNGKKILGGVARATAGGVGAFELEAFLKVKFSKLEKTAHQKKNVSGQTNSTVAELSKFNTKVANEHYKVKKEDSLEAILLALHLPGDQEKLDLNPRVAAAYKDLQDYQDLLLLGDLATITQEKHPYSWISGAPNLSPEAQTALTTSLLGITLKLTGAKLAFKRKLKLPGGKMRSKNRTEVVAYLALIQNILDAMAGSKNWKAAAKDSNLDKMHADISKIIAEF